MVDGVDLVRRAVDAVNAGTMAEVAPEIIAPGFVRHDLSDAWSGVAGPAGATDFIAMLRTAMPDLRIEIEDIFSSDNRVAMRFVLTGTHSGELLGVAGSNKRVEVNGINVYRLEDGKLAETWQLMDIAGLLNQVRG